MSAIGKRLTGDDDPKDVDGTMTLEQLAELESTNEDWQTAARAGRFIRPGGVYPVSEPAHDQERADELD
ncbi:hypothetical protein [Compostimonas suwonensis]|uniref:Uncharacterized protein n=1 Tax=Compostimonas suwonensis TaxID=1048394 RepID=A0A2M9BU44_9MICO|nr:hypothetical protein [Compostimonas suwonensis]PJJ61450.1 hypothetical protein CLV54_2395 [Compostimonas suwonensis]